MIELFDAIVRARAVLPEGTVLRAVRSDEGTDLRGIEPEGPPFVLGGLVVVEALLGVVLLGLSAVLRLEGGEVEVLH
jgi:hypothetical protein